MLLIANVGTSILRLTLGFCFLIEVKLSVWQNFGNQPQKYFVASIVLIRQWRSIPKGVQFQSKHPSAQPSARIIPKPPTVRHKTSSGLKLYDTLNLDGRSIINEPRELNRAFVAMDRQTGLFRNFYMRAVVLTLCSYTYISFVIR